MEWKPELDAIVGARHGGQITHVLDRLRALDARYPNIGEIQYQLAWTCEMQGDARAALHHYEKAMALGLPTNELSGALIGLGTTLRTLGQHARAVEVLASARTQFPENREIEVFLALALRSAGRADEAVSLLIETLLEVSDDVGLSAYQRSIRHHAGTGS